MFEHSFFSSKVGQAALVSIAAMITFVIFTDMQRDFAQNDTMLSSAQVVDLA